MQKQCAGLIEPTLIRLRLTEVSWCKWRIWSAETVEPREARDQVIALFGVAEVPTPHDERMGLHVVKERLGRLNPLARIEVRS